MTTHSEPTSEAVEARTWFIEDCLRTHGEDLLAQFGGDTLGSQKAAIHNYHEAMKELRDLRTALTAAEERARKAEDAVDDYCCDYCEGRPADEQRAKCSFCPLYDIAARDAVEEGR